MKKGLDYSDNLAGFLQLILEDYFVYLFFGATRDMEQLYWSNKIHPIKGGE